MSMKCSRSSGTPQQRPAARASPRRIIVLIICTSGLSTWPGFLLRRNSSTCASSSAARLRRDVEVRVELGHELGEANRIVVEHGDVAGRLVGDVHFVALIHQADQRAAHRDHVIVRMRRKDEHPLGEDVVVSVTCGRPAAWRAPACRPASR